MQISVRVTPKARKECFEETKQGEFTASVKERAERNEANDRVQWLVARHFNVPLTNVRFLTGVRGKKKVFDVVQ